MQGVEEVSKAGEELSPKQPLTRVRTRSRQRSGGVQHLINFEDPESCGCERRLRKSRTQINFEEPEKCERQHRSARMQLGQRAKNSGGLGSCGRKPRNARLQLGRSTAE